MTTTRPHSYFEVYGYRNTRAAPAQLTPPKTPSSQHGPLLAPPSPLPDSGPPNEEVASIDGRTRLRRQVSIERTRTWAEDVRRANEQRDQDRKSSWLEDEAISDALGSISSITMDSLIQEMNPTLDLKPKSSSYRSPTQRSAEFVLADQNSSRPVRAAGSSSQEESAGQPGQLAAPKNNATNGHPSPKKRKSQCHLDQVANPTTTPSHSPLLLGSHPIPTCAPAPTRTPILSIDEIVRKHAGKAEKAQAVATEKAKVEIRRTSVLPPRRTAANIEEFGESGTSISKQGDWGQSPSWSTPESGVGREKYKEEPKHAQSLSGGQRHPRRPVHLKLRSTSERSPPSIPVRTSSVAPPSHLAISPRTSSKFDTAILGSLTDTSGSTESFLQNLFVGQAFLDRLDGNVSPKAPSAKRLSVRLSSNRNFPTLSRTASTTSRQSTPSQMKMNETEAMAIYLRSPRLTRILTFPRAFPERPLQVSLADVGKPTGRPVVVFLGLGCVRYLVALFDELATAFGLRLICIDRWGLGKTDNISQGKRGLLDWAVVVEKCLEELGIDTFQILAHSAGAPYALATALRMGNRVRGKIHLLSPWVSAEIDGGYKWLKWVPNGVIKTAQAAEWKLQSYMLGKPPPTTYRPIEHVSKAPVSRDSLGLGLGLGLGIGIQSRDSLDSVAHSAYDDLADFDGRIASETYHANGLRRKASRIFQSPEPAVSAMGNSPRPKHRPSTSVLRSHSDKSLPSRSSLQAQTPPGSCHPTLDFGLGEGFDTFGTNLDLTSPTPSRKSYVPDAPSFSLALMQASHAESLVGGTADLLTILEKDSKPWGFEYTDVEHQCKIWYGTNDDKISERSMRWMERCMDAELRVLKGEGHNLVTSSNVMFEVFESLVADLKRV
ncbi:hypothetical protein P7C73_g2643, partial [Tremellales sp. Uapishka_1]